MKHLHKASGLEFECGELIDRADGKTYDITVITYWGDLNAEELRAPILVSFYFGEYDADATDRFIDRWLKEFKDCKAIIDAYWVTNSDVLEEPWRSKALSAIDAVNTITDMLQLGGDV